MQQSTLDFGQQIVSMLDDLIRGGTFSTGINSGVCFCQQIGIDLIQQKGFASGYVRRGSMTALVPAWGRVVGKRECQLMGSRAFQFVISFTPRTLLRFVATMR